jgi:hypothetical protein
MTAADIVGFKALPNILSDFKDLIALTKKGKFFMPLHIVIYVEKVREFGETPIYRTIPSQATK